MNKLVVIIVVIFLAYKGWGYWQEEINVATIAAHDEVIMYSLTTCGYCKAKAKELRANNIEFIEYYIDKDDSRKAEIETKMMASGIKPRSIGVPILDVKGKILPNNPSLKKIRKYI